MSVRVMVQVWELDLPPTDKLLLLGLADFANDHGECWPSIGRLAHKTGVAKRTAQVILRRLEAAGLLEVAKSGGRGPGSTTRYLIHPDKGAARAPFHPAVRAQSDAPRAQQSAHKGAADAPNPSRPVIEPSPTRALATIKPRPRDLLWEALVETCGEPVTRSERGRYNQALKQLREAGVNDPMLIRSAVHEYRRRWPHIDLTPSGIAGNWRLLTQPRRGGVTHLLDRIAQAKGEGDA